MAEDADDGAGDEGRLRASAADIYERVKREAAEELERPVASLAFSGLFAGATVGFGTLASASGSCGPGRPAGRTTGWRDRVPDRFHRRGHRPGPADWRHGVNPAVVHQVFTENTLYPVTLVLDDRRHLWTTLRLWLVVLGSNLIGVALFALLVTKTGALAPSVVSTIAEDGRRAALGSWASFFWSAVFGGWAIALVAWLIQSSGVVIGQIALIWALVFVVGLAGLSHSVSTTTEVLSAVFRSQVGGVHAVAWFAAVVLGNIVGGVLITAVLNFGQVRAGED